VRLYGHEALKFRIADTIYAGAMGPRAAFFQRAVRDAYSRNALTKTSPAEYGDASLKYRRASTDSNSVIRVSNPGSRNGLNPEAVYVIWNSPHSVIYLPATRR